MNDGLTAGVRATRTGLLGLTALWVATAAGASTTECPAHFEGKRLTHAAVSDGPSRELPFPQSSRTKLSNPPVYGRAYYIVCNYGTTALSLPLPPEANTCWYKNNDLPVCGREPGATVP